MKILLGEFKDNGEELAEFLEPRIGVKPKASGEELNIDDESIRKAVKPRHVKTYIKRFLLKKDERSQYKIIVEGSELTLIYLEKEEEKEKEKEEKKREEEKAKRASQQKEEATEQEKEAEPAGEEKAEPEAESSEGEEEPKQS